MSAAAERRPIYSMTGFATLRGATRDGAEFTLSAKSVNHRFLDLQFRLPGGLDGLEMRLRQALKTRLRRGHVDVTLTLGRAEASDVRVDDARLAMVIGAFRTAAERHGIAGEPDLNALLRLPGVLGATHSAGPGAADGLEETVAATVDMLLDQLLRARAEEGASLVKELRSSMERLRGMQAEVGELRGGVREAHLERLRSRLAELLGGANVSEDRLLTEAALLTDRSDVEEENVRLLTHVERFVGMLDDGGEVGKRLDFLLQELNREANTMLSKTGGAMGGGGLRLTEIALEMKAEMERAREQVQNLE